MKDASDEELLRGCIAGDRRAWDALVTRFTRYVYYLIHATGKRYGAEFTEERCADLHNDLFVALMEDDCRRLRAFEGKNGCSVRSWIRVITVRRTLDALRRRKKFVSIDDTEGDAPPRQLVSEDPDPLEQLIAQGDARRRARLHELTATLSEADQLLLQMIYEQKLSAGEVAAALRIKKGAVYTRKTRLIQRLHQAAVDAGLVLE